MQITELLVSEAVPRNAPNRPREPASDFSTVSRGSEHQSVEVRAQSRSSKPLAPGQAVER